MDLNLSLPYPDIKFCDKLHRDKFIWENTSYDEWFAIIIKSGMFNVTMNNKSAIAAEGDVVIFPPDIVFSRHIIKPLNFLYINFKWNLNYPDNLYNEYTLCGKLDFIDDTRVKEDIEVLFAFSDQHSAGALSVFNYYFCDIIYEYWKIRMINRIVDYKNITDKIIAESVDQINKFYQSPLRISEIAANCNMSHVNFTNRFIRAIGMTPIEYLQRIRLNKAQTLLLSTNLSIYEISRYCGFENQFYFSRSFSKFYGVSPSKYRTRNLV